MQKIIVASKNPVKINATLDGFIRMFASQQVDIEGVSAASDVPDQPIGDEQTLAGAINRTINAQKAMSDADFWVGLEGGITSENGQMHAYAWVSVLGRTGVRGIGKTGTFVLPPQIARLVTEGKELGEADDIVFGKTNSKQDTGATGLLTGNVLTRTGFYSDAVVLALIPFKNPSLYEAKA